MGQYRLNEAMLFHVHNDITDNYSNVREVIKCYVKDSEHSYLECEFLVNFTLSDILIRLFIIFTI